MSDQAAAELLRQCMASSLQDKSVRDLHAITGLLYSQIKRVVRSLPGDFGLYKKTDDRHWVKYFAGPQEAQVGLKQRH